MNTKVFGALGFTLAASIAAFACSSSSSDNSGSSSSNTSNSGSSGGSNSSSSGSSSSGSSSSSGATLPPSSQCNDLATAICKLLAQCDTFDMQSLFGGSQTACAARTVYSCPDVTERGTSNTSTTVEACATNLGKITTCAAYQVYLAANNGNLCPSAAGALAINATCLDDSQCTSGYCGASVQEASTSDCGSCATTPTPSDCEENSNCPSGQLCNADGTCVTPGGVGTACDNTDPSQASQPCLPNLFCQFSSPVQPLDGGNGPSMGVCAALIANGQPCDATDPALECVDGSYCNSQNTCAAIQFIQANGACDNVGLVCSGGECNFDATDGGNDGVCQAYVADGASCDDDSDCQYGASCPNGTCTVAPETCD